MFSNKLINYFKSKNTTEISEEKEKKNIRINQYAIKFSKNIAKKSKITAYDAVSIKKNRRKFHRKHIFLNHSKAEES